MGFGSNVGSVGRPPPPPTGFNDEQKKGIVDTARQGMWDYAKKKEQMGIGGPDSNVGVTQKAGPPMYPEVKNEDIPNLPVEEQQGPPGTQGEYSTPDNRLGPQTPAPPGVENNEFQERAMWQAQGLEKQLNDLVQAGYGPGTQIWNEQIRGHREMYDPSNIEGGESGWVLDFNIQQNEDGTYSVGWENANPATNINPWDTMGRARDNMNELRATDPRYDYNWWMGEMANNPEVQAARGNMLDTRNQYMSSLDPMQARAMGESPSVARLAGNAQRQNAMRDISTQASMQSGGVYNPAVASMALQRQGQVGADMAAQIAAAEAAERMQAEQSYANASLRGAGLDQSLLGQEYALRTGPAGFAMQGQGNLGNYLVGMGANEGPSTGETIGGIFSGTAGFLSGALGL